MNLILHLPDDLAMTLQDIALDHKTSIQQLALDGLRTLASGDSQRKRPAVGSPAALLAFMREPSSLLLEDVEALDAAIAAGRQHVCAVDIF